MLLPELDSGNEAYWTGGRDGSLLVTRCRSCRKWIHPPVPYCSTCGDRDVAPEPVSGLGHVHSFTVNHLSWVAEDDWQRVIALVELDEQPALRVLTNIVDCEPDAVTIGMRVGVTFREAEDVFVPVFHPAP